MLNRLIPYLGFGRDPIGPHFYRLSCRKCAYEEMVEKVDSPEEAKDGSADGSAQKTRLVTELPRQCPNCGASLKTQRLPCKIFR